MYARLTLYQTDYSQHMLAGLMSAAVLGGDRAFMDGRRQGVIVKSHEDFFHYFMRAAHECSKRSGDIGRSSADRWLFAVETPIMDVCTHEPAGWEYAGDLYVQAVPGTAGLNYSYWKGGVDGE